MPTFAKYIPILAAGCATSELERLEKLEEGIDLASQAWCDDSRASQVVDVHDGDTITLSAGSEKIRFLDVAAPEVEKLGEPAECFGNESAAFLRSVLEEETIILEFDVECEDMYSRTLAWVFLEGSDPWIAGMMDQYDLPGLMEDGSYSLLVNELLVRGGYAEIFEGDVAQNIRYSERMKEAEEEAELQALGLWSACP
jgi:micrococcal nuclease